MALARFHDTHRNPYSGRFRVTAYPVDGQGARVYPVTVDQLKAELGIPASEVAQDMLLADKIAEATEAAQKYTGRFFLTHSCEYTLDLGSDRHRVTNLGTGIRQGSISQLAALYDVELRGLPVASVTEIVATNEAGTETVIAPASYQVDAFDQNLWARVVFGVGASTSIVAARSRNGLTVRYDVGYGDASSVPAAIVSGVKMWAVWLYENRGDCGAMTDVAPAAKAALRGYRVLRV